MKKKILFGCIGILTIVCAISLFTSDIQSVSGDNDSDDVTEHDIRFQDKEPAGDGMIWELSRHFVTVN